jgi:hypothetical protein
MLLCRYQAVGALSLIIVVNINQSAGTGANTTSSCETKTGSVASGRTQGNRAMFPQFSPS